MITLPPPNQLGLPEHFSQWRPYQQDTIAAALSATTRFIGINAPTGAGKSVLAEIIAQFTGGRSAYLVMTKPLADQITDKQWGIPYRYDVRGKSNYNCIRLNEHGLWGTAATAEKAEGMCEACSLKQNGCEYYDAVRRAGREQHPVTNYDFHLSIAEYGGKESTGIGTFDLLICDEAHDIYRKLSSFMRIELDYNRMDRVIRRPMPAESQPIEKWREWARAHYHTAAAQLDMVQQAIKAGTALPTRDLTELKRVTTDLERLQRMGDDWVEDRQTDKSHVGFEPVNVAPYAYKLWQNTPKIVLMSAMLRDKHFADLGVKRNEYTLIESPSSVEVRRRPIIHVKTVQQRATMTEAAQMSAIRRLDQIIGPRIGNKGIIHTASYDRAKLIQLHSEYSGLMMLHDSKGTARVVEQFKKTLPPAIFTSPSVTTGYNFPGDEARWQNIFKVPFEPSNPINRARKKHDPDAGKFAAWVDFVQACGRIVRGPLDWGETLCTDDSIVWLYIEALRKGWAPGWIIPAIQLNKLIPQPLMIAA